MICVNQWNVKSYLFHRALKESVRTKMKNVTLLKKNCMKLFQYINAVWIKTEFVLVANWITTRVPTVWVCGEVYHVWMPELITSGLCPLPPDGQTLSQGPVDIGALCLTARHCAIVVIFFLQEMVSDWEQCVNSPVTLDKPARRPVTGTYGMFDRERGCESHWMIKWCFSPFGNVMLSGKRVDHRSLKRLTPASLWHLLQGPEFLCLAPGQFWHCKPLLLAAARLACRCGKHNWISV